MTKVTLSGKEPAPGLDGASPAPQPIDERTGMHGDYWVLSADERAKGFVRPVRAEYQHSTCGSVTTMNIALAETYARDPKFYGATFCVRCRTHRPVAEFVWYVDGRATGEEVGS